MVTAWRIILSRHAREAFTGEGARLHGGRWNSIGVPIVYCSSTRALAALETLVHINPRAVLDYSIISVRFNERVLEIFPSRSLPSNWNATPPGPASRRVGDRWAKESRSAVLGVPSCLSGELNYLFNPRHRDFRRIKIGVPEPFTFDPRLL
jgi:RES domain-containing protein